MSNNNDVVIIELDRPRELRFGHKALKRIQALMGKSMEEMSEEDIDFGQIEEIFLYGLQRDAREHGETLTLDMMEDILDFAVSEAYLIMKMYEAMNKAMGSVGGNAQAVGKPPATRKTASRGTGKSR
ncbi:MAG: hypothetical protein P0Y55_12055 [Candidatus Cohnella colombiensis]|uniref:Tail assembly chaperone n=1 Tax=Candidatus Cohnella colombiensis TaxID=3121368 RepID=A0AA95JF43_9BACL|nr:MAG: hypothetical protein P0Y55_12055 [Cohnella sp.]